jgi:hypothetical protein
LTDNILPDVSVTSNKKANPPGNTQRIGLIMHDYGPAMVMIFTSPVAGLTQDKPADFATSQQLGLPGATGLLKTVRMQTFGFDVETVISASFVLPLAEHGIALAVPLVNAPTAKIAAPIT